MLLVDGCNSSCGEQAVSEEMSLVLWMTAMATGSVGSAPCQQCHQQAGGFQVSPV